MVYYSPPFAGDGGWLCEPSSISSPEFRGYLMKGEEVNFIASEMRME